MIVAGIQSEHALVNGDGFIESVRLGQQLAQILHRAHVRPRGQQARKCSPVLFQELLPQVPLRLLDRFTHEPDAMVQFRRGRPHHQPQDIGAIGVEFPGFLGEPQGFERIFGFHRGVGRLLGSPFGVVLFHGLSHLVDAAVLDQFRQPGVQSVRSVEVLPWIRACNSRRARSAAQENPLGRALAGSERSDDPACRTCFAARRRSRRALAADGSRRFRLISGPV